MDALLPLSDGASSGNWSLVGGTSIADILDMLDDDSYAWRDGAVVDDYFDVKLDLTCGELTAQDDFTIYLRARVLGTGQKTAELTFAFYQGDPGDGGTFLDDTKQNLSDSAWTTYDRTVPLSLIAASVTDLDDLWMRVSITKIVGGGDEPQPAVSQLWLELPDVSRSVKMPLGGRPDLMPSNGQKCHVRLVGGTRVRKVTFTDAGGGHVYWTDRDSNTIHNEDVREWENPE